MFVWVADQDSLLGFGVQLPPLLLWHMHICYAAEHPQVCQVRLLLEVQLLWWHFISSCRCLILKVHGCSDCFGPIKFGHALLLQNRPSRVFDRLVLPRSVCWTMLVEFLHCTDNWRTGWKNILLPPLDLRHLIFQLVSHWARLFTFKNHEKILLFFSIKHSHVSGVLSLMKVTKYRIPPTLTLCVGPHTSEWIKSSLFRLQFCSLGNWSR